MYIKQFCILLNFLSHATASTSAADISFTYYIKEKLVHVYMYSFFSL